MDFFSEEIINEFFRGHPHWRGVLDVADRLKQNGFQAWLAGGCVRDLLLQRTPNDFDIATDALPDQVEKLFARSIAVGKAFGVMVIPYDDFQIEVTTFRSDGEYKDGRHPETVTFSSPEEDAQRRDFTVNALFYDLEKNQIVDFVGGKEDLDRRRIRCVGEPLHRFGEDQLRVLRGIRFAVQLDFVIEEKTWRAIKERAGHLHLVSAERVREEWNKLLLSERAAMGLQLLEFSGLWGEIFPQWAKIAAHPAVWLEVKATADAFTPAMSLEERTAALLFQLSGKAWPSFDGLQDQELVAAVKQSAGEQVEKTLLHLKSPKEFYRNVAGRLTSLKLLEYKNRLRSGCQQLVWRKELPQAWLSGADLKALGIAPGPRIGELLSEAYLRQLEGLDASRENQLKWLKSRCSAT